MSSLGHSQGDVPATRREAGEHQGPVQQHPIQPQGDGQEHPETRGMCHGILSPTDSPGYWWILTTF